MGQEVIHVSDLTGQRIENPDEQLVSVIVTQHPDLDPDKQVRLDALPGELEPLAKAAIKEAVVLEVTQPGEDAATRHIVRKPDFNKLATSRPMEEVLAAAAVVRAVAASRRSHSRTTNGDPLRTFDTLESAGLPHQGKISAAEAKLVRENLETVNANRAGQSLAPIDPTNPSDAKRYGFDPLS